MKWNYRWKVRIARILIFAPRRIKRGKFFLLQSKCLHEVLTSKDYTPTPKKKKKKSYLGLRWRIRHNHIFFIAQRRASIRTFRSFLWEQKLSVALCVCAFLWVPAHVCVSVCGCGGVVWLMRRRLETHRIRSHKMCANEHWKCLQKNG